jgi:hypothetical protein
VLVGLFSQLQLSGIQTQELQGKSHQVRTEHWRPPTPGWDILPHRGHWHPRMPSIGPMGTQFALCPLQVMKLSPKRTGSQASSIGAAAWPATSSPTWTPCATLCSAVSGSDPSAHRGLLLLTHLPVQLLACYRSSAQLLRHLQNHVYHCHICISLFVDGC